MSAGEKKQCGGVAAVWGPRFGGLQDMGCSSGSSLVPKCSSGGPPAWRQGGGPAAGLWMLSMGGRWGQRGEDLTCQPPAATPKLPLRQSELLPLNGKSGCNLGPFQSLPSREPAAIRQRGRRGARVGALSSALNSTPPIYTTVGVPAAPVTGGTLRHRHHSIPLMGVQHLLGAGGGHTGDAGGPGRA